MMPPEAEAVFNTTMSRLARQYLFEDMELDEYRRQVDQDWADHDAAVIETTSESFLDLVRESARSFFTNLRT